jgi:hypothetical protein
VKANVVISDSAFFELLMNGLEAYAVPHGGEYSVETYAHIWGEITKPRSLKFSIEHVSVDTSAARNRASVSSLSSSYELKSDISKIFGRGYSHLGSFHTHPWVYGEPMSADKVVSKPADIRDNALYGMSDGDYRAEFNRCSKFSGSAYSVSLIMTIFSMQKADSRIYQNLHDNCFEFSLGNIKIWINAQVFEHVDSEYLSPGQHDAIRKLGVGFSAACVSNCELTPVPLVTTLKCEFLKRHTAYLAGFGRLLKKDGKDGKDGGGWIYSSESESENRWFKDRA